MNPDIFKHLKKVVLISASPRRKEILESIGIYPEVTSVETDESVKKNEKPVEYVLRVAKDKMYEYLENNPQEEDALYITADTIVTLHNYILQKPWNEQDARAMLEFLSGKKHEVISGVFLILNGQRVSFFEKSEVWFKHLSNEEIDWYIRTDEPFDKAGAYGIQGYAKMFIRRIEGCYFNIVGFPIFRFYTECLKLTGDSDV